MIKLQSSHLNSITTCHLTTNGRHSNAMSHNDRSSRVTIVLSIEKSPIDRLLWPTKAVNTSPLIMSRQTIRGRDWPLRLFPVPQRMHTQVLQLLLLSSTVFSVILESPGDIPRVFPRDPMPKGGGSGGKGGGGGGGGGKSSGNGVASSGKSSGSGSISSSHGGSGYVSSSSRGDPKVSKLPKGSKFAGRECGGGTRENVYGGRQVFSSLSTPATYNLQDIWKWIPWSCDPRSRHCWEKLTILLLASRFHCIYHTSCCPTIFPSIRGELSFFQSTR